LKSNAGPFDPADAAARLATPNEFFRFAVAEFERAKLVYGHGTADGYDEAAFIVLEGLALPVDALEPHLEKQLTDTERIRLAALIHDRIVTRKPAPYLLHRAYIRGHGFYVDERAIVPRSYIGEILGDSALIGESAALVPDTDAVRSVLDLCTGSGCLAILAALAFPNAQVDAADISPDALDVAAINVRDYGMENRVRLVEGDLYAPLGGRTYDLILANPPYVDAEGMAALPPEYRAEPALALAGGASGIDLAVRIVKDAAAHLNPDGGLICEVGHAGPAMEKAFPSLEFLWLDTETSTGEVFWADRAALSRLG
jgi:ribosomal protein L3 glutamine methyltransferase